MLGACSACERDWHVLYTLVRLNCVKIVLAFEEKNKILNFSGLYLYMCESCICFS